MLDALGVNFWWSYTFDNIANILIGCPVYSKDKPILKLIEELKFLEKDSALF